MKPLLEVIGQPDRSELQVAAPEEGYHRGLISCQRACPVHTDARGYVRAIADGRFEEAYLIARGPNPFASICGRICGAPCEAACRRGRIPRMDADGNFLGLDRPIAIRALKRFVCERFGPEAQAEPQLLSRIRSYVPKVAADAEEMAWLLRGALEGKFQPASGQAVAVIGGGPAGLSAAHDLALLGFRPVVFEAERIAGGMLALGVPEYRLPAELIRSEISVIEALGVELKLGVRVGEGITLKQIRDDFSAVVIAVGAKLSRELGLPGERGPGVFGGVDFLRSVALAEPVEVGRDVLVIGGGNVAYDVARTVVRQAAYDAARTAARLPGRPTVKLVSLETLEEMPADTIEILEGDEEGIERLNGWGPLEIQRNDRGEVIGVLFRRCTRVYDENRRFDPVFDDSETHQVACDSVLMAVGQSTDLSFLAEGGQDVEQFRPGWPKLDPESQSTTAPGVFVAGDLAHGTRLLIDAVASGKKAARAVYAYLTGHTLRAEVLEFQLTLDRYYREKGYESLRRVQIPVLPPENRLDSPGRLVELGYSEEEARREASRCLDCGITPVFDGQRCVLCGGCVDVCPTVCLKIVPLSAVPLDDSLRELTEQLLGPTPDPEDNSLILKDEDRCIRCGLCALRCPVDAIAMERTVFTTCWR